MRDRELFRLKIETFLKNVEETANMASSTKMASSPRIVKFRFELTEIFSFSCFPSYTSFSLYNFFFFFCEISNLSALSFPRVSSIPSDAVSIIRLD